MMQLRCDVERVFDAPVSTVVYEAYRVVAARFERDYGLPLTLRDVASIGAVFVRAHEDQRVGDLALLMSVVDIAVEKRMHRQTRRATMFLPSAVWRYWRSVALLDGYMLEGLDEGDYFAALLKLGTQVVDYSLVHGFDASMRDKWADFALGVDYDVSLPLRGN